MEMSNVQRIQSFSYAFDAAVRSKNFGNPPVERWDDAPYAVEVAEQMKEFGEKISHNHELYQDSFLRHARACADKIEKVAEASQAYTILQTIPGLALAR